MGRRKVPVQRIEDNSSRHVSFSKRRKGLIKKASEISVLCDVDVALVVFSGGGRLYEFCSTESLPKIVQRYCKSSETESTFSKCGCEEESGNASARNSSELLHVVERLEEPHVEQLSVADLLQLEEEIADSLINIRSRKTRLIMDSVLALQEQEKKLKEENSGLKGQLGGLAIDLNTAIDVETNNHLERPLLNLL